MKGQMLGDTEDSQPGTIHLMTGSEDDETSETDHASVAINENGPTESVSISTSSYIRLDVADVKRSSATI